MPTRNDFIPFVRLEPGVVVDLLERKPQEFRRGIADLHPVLRQRAVRKLCTLSGQYIHRIEQQEDGYRTMGIERSLTDRADSFVVNLCWCLRPKVKPYRVLPLSLGVLYDSLTCVIAGHEPAPHGFGAAQERPRVQNGHRVLQIRVMEHKRRPPRACLARVLVLQVH
jgi:hypothetical protein